MLPSAKDIIRRPDQVTGRLTEDEKLRMQEHADLYQKEQKDDEPIVMVHLKNSTAEPDGSIKDYFIRVPPTIRRAGEAVAWTFGMTEQQYQPLVQS